MFAENNNNDRLPFLNWSDCVDAWPIVLGHTKSGIDID